jgi:hypothetical protein
MMAAFERTSSTLSIISLGMTYREVLTHPDSLIKTTPLLGHCTNGSITLMVFAYLSVLGPQVALTCHVSASLSGYDWSLQTVSKLIVLLSAQKCCSWINVSLSEFPRKCAAWVRRVKPNLPTALCALCQVAELLRDLHAAGYAYGAVKPTNVAWFANCRSWQLIDFSHMRRIGACLLTHRLSHAPGYLTQGISTRPHSVMITLSRLSGNVTLYAY